MTLERTPLLRPRPRPRPRNSFLWTRVRYYVPVLSWAPQYATAQLPGDVLAGLSVACLLVPQALSYAQAIVRVAPVFGLHTSIAPLLAYALLGTSRQLSVGPEALVSILTAAAVAEGGANSPAERIAAANLLALMVGVFTFLLGFFRLGFLDSVLSRALLRGFVTAVALVVIIDQSENLLGILPVDVIPPSNSSIPFNNLNNNLKNNNINDTLIPSKPSPIETLFNVIEHLNQSHVPTTIVSFCSIVFLVSVKSVKSALIGWKFVQAVPEILILVLFSTLVSWAFRLDLLGVQVMMDVEGGLRAPQWPAITLPRVRFYILSAILISVIGFVESIVIGKTYASKYNYSVSPNRELVALGVSNIVGSFFGAWPAFGSLGRSAVNDAAGGRTQVSGLVTCIVILITTVYLLPYFYFLPKAVCSSIIVVAATKLIELHDVQFILQVRAWNDLGLLLLTFLTTLFVSIEVGTLISVGTSLLLVVKHTTKTRIAILGRTLIPDPTTTGSFKPKFRPLSDKSDTATPIERIDHCLILRIEEGLFFGNSGQLKDRLKRIELFGDLNVHPGEAPQQQRRMRTRSPSSGGTPREATNSLLSGSSSLRTREERRRSLSSDTGRGAAGTAAGSGSRSNSVSPAVEEDGEDLDEFDALLEEEEREGQTAAHFNDPSDLVSIIFDVGAVTAIDATATQTLVEVVESYQSRNISVSFVKLRNSCKPWFDRSGLTQMVTPAYFFDKVSDALDAHYRLEGTNRLQSPSTPFAISVPNTPTSRRAADSSSGSYQNRQPMAPPLRFVGDLEFGEDEEEDDIPYVHPRTQAVVPPPAPPQPTIGSWGTDDIRGGFTSGANTATTTTTRLGRPSFVNGLSDGFHSGFSAEASSGVGVGVVQGARVPGQLRGRAPAVSSLSSSVGNSGLGNSVVGAMESDLRATQTSGGSQYFSSNLDVDLEYGSDNVWD